MHTLVIEPRPAAAVASPYLLELLARARGVVEVDPRLARRCLEEISRYLSDGSPDPMEHALIPSLATSESGDIAKGGLAAWQIRRVRDYVEAHLDETILIEELAVVARLSPGHFCRAFKVSTADTPHGYVVRQRIRRAQWLMLRTEDSLSQIACACGMTDQAHLTRLFRKLVNDTPLSWRRAWRAA